MRWVLGLSHEGIADTFVGMRNPERNEPAQRRKAVTRALGGGTKSAAELAGVIGETRLDIARLMEAALHQLLDPRLGRGAGERRHESVPFRLDLRIRRQVGQVGE